MTRASWFGIDDDEIGGIPTENIDVLLRNSQGEGFEGSLILVRNHTEAVKMVECNELVLRTQRVLTEARSPRIPTLMRFWTLERSSSLSEPRISLMHSEIIGENCHDRCFLQPPLEPARTSDAAAHRERPTSAANSSEAMDAGRVHPDHSLPASFKRVVNKTVTAGKFFRFELPGYRAGYSARVSKRSCGVWAAIDGNEVFGFTPVFGHHRQEASSDLESYDGDGVWFKLQSAESSVSWSRSTGKHEFNTDVRIMDDYLEREQSRERALRMLRNVSEQCDMRILDASDTHVRWICSDFDTEDMCSTEIYRRIDLQAINSENVKTDLTLRCPSPWMDRLIMFGFAALIYLIIRVCVSCFRREVTAEALPKYERFDLNDEKVAPEHGDKPPKYDDVALEHTQIPREAAQVDQKYERSSPGNDGAVPRGDQLV